MLNFNNIIPYYIMFCSYTTRCDNSKLIYFDNIFICQNCSSIFKKPNKKLNKKIVKKFCDKQIIDYKYNIPICDNCLSMCVINI